MAKRNAPKVKPPLDPESEAWNTLAWRKLEQHCLRIQKRIFRASQRGHTRAVHKLQKLLMKSQSARLLAVRRVTPQPVRRVYIPKPGKDERRPLGIPVMLDRGQQALVKLKGAPAMRRAIKGWLKAGVVDNGVFDETRSGTPQGGIVSPLLANIYLDKLDKFVEQTLVPGSTRGEGRR